jgi:flagellar biosynthetic protein FliO
MTKAFVGAWGALVSFLLCFFVAAKALGAPPPLKVTGLTVKRSGAGVSLDLVFDRAMPAKSLKPTFERNFVQIALKPARMDTARMIPVTESEVQKVFAYPYSRDVARVRIIFRHDNKWAKGKISLWNNNPRSVRVFIKDPQTVAQVSAVQKSQAKSQPKPELKPEPAAPLAAAAAPAPAPSPAEAEDKALLKEVMANTRDIDIHNPDSIKNALVDKPKAHDGSPERDTMSRDNSNDTSVGIKADPSRHFARMAAALFGVLALFFSGVFLLKRYASKIKGLPFGKKERLIQVIASHHLGNKKSISLVKVTGEYMVVGVGNEGISLISKLGREIDVEKYIEDRFWGGTFEKHLDNYSKDPKVTKDVDLSLAAPDPAKYDGVRDVAPAQVASEQITDKIELSPVRASIKEKLTKLKPLGDA